MADVTIEDIPDFPGLPGQRPTPGDSPTVVPIEVVLIKCNLDKGYLNMSLGSTGVDAMIAAKVAAGEAYENTVERWSPWSSLQIELDFASAVGFNYARFTIGDRSWYAFLDAEYLDLTVTLFNCTEDAWTTYGPTVGYSLVSRAHVAVAASQDDTYGDLFLTAPEPIEAPPVRGVLDAPLLGSHPSEWTVLVVSANDLRGGEFGPERFWELHINNPGISTASTLASGATINSSGEVQTAVDAGRYPWSTGSPPSPPEGEPDNGFVPEDLLTVLATAVGTNPAQAELNTAAAWADVVASYPGAHISPTVSGAPASPAGYWSRALDTAIHADPALYGITDPDLSPIGESKHGLGIRINVAGVSPAIMASFGFSEFNSYTYTFTGPYSWDAPTPGTLEVFVPQVIESPVSTIDGVPAGGGCYLFTMRGFAEYMTIMQGAPWVTNGIVDLRLVPTWAVAGGGDHEFTSRIPSRDPSDAMWVEAADIPNFVAEVTSATATPAVLADWRAAAFAAVGANPVYRKLLTSQFTDLLIGNGDVLASFKPDQWHADNVMFEAVTGAAHGDPSIRLIPTGYNELGTQMGIDSPVGGRAGTTRSGFGQAASDVAQADVAPFLNAYGTNSSWQTMFRQRELAQSLELTNVQLSLGQAGISSALGAVTSAAQGALGGAAVGGPAGAVVGGALGLAGTASGLVSAAISANNTIQLLAIETDGSFDIGAYQLGIAGESTIYSFDTWWQALASKPGGGTPDNLASSWRAIIGQAFEVIIAMPSADRIASLLTMWDRYGYTVDRAMIPPRLDPMTHWSYWETENATILGDLPQESRDAIAAAFDRGVTIWVDPSEIGSHPDNEPRSGVTY